MSQLCLRIVVFAVSLGSAAAEESGEAQGRLADRICASDEAELAFLRTQSAVIEMLKNLPADHKIKPSVQYIWSDDEEKRIPCLVALSPVDVEGKPDGDEYQFGDEERVVPFRHGVKHGIERRYGSHGKERRLLSETPWEKDIIHGIQKVYHLANGKLHMEIPYDSGRRQGLAKTYDLPGRLVKVTPYRDDKTDGKVVEYYPSTEREKKVIPFRQGKVHGLVLEYYEDGTRKHELPALDDRFHGVEKEYDEKGQLIRTRYWLDDELVTKEDYVKGQTK